MNERPTPETDAIWKDYYHGELSWVDLHFAMQDFERERDEAREAFAIATDQLVQEQIKNRKLREAVREAHKALQELEWEGNEKGTRCIGCGYHCTEDHAEDCKVHSALIKLRSFLEA